MDSYDRNDFDECDWDILAAALADSVQYTRFAIVPSHIHCMAAYMKKGASEPASEPEV